MTEADLQNMVLDLCKHMNLLAYHVYDSRRSVPGFPDLVIVGATDVLYRELKTQKGRLRPEQDQWLEALHATGANASVWRPSDWPTRIHTELSALGPVSTRVPAMSQADARRYLQGRS